MEGKYFRKEAGEKLRYTELFDWETNKKIGMFFFKYNPN